MIFGETLRNRLNATKAIAAGLPLAFLSQAASAQDAATAPAAAASAAPAGAATYVPMGADMIKGQPSPGAMWFQTQHSPIGHDALWMNDYILTPVMIVITAVVLFLLLWVIVRYNKRANPVPSKTSHNTLLEVLWTGIPILILVMIAVPSLGLLAEQYKSPPKDALTIKATGYQWYWGYTYPDYGGFEVISNMLKEPDEVKPGERARTTDDGPMHLAADHRMVVPVGVPIRLQTYGSDVIHSFAVPSLWFKLDAVPGRINEKVLQIDEPGVYFGQCSELCGARHGYMPIAVEAVPMDVFKAWVRTQPGGTIPGETPAPAPAASGAPAPAATPAAAPVAPAPAPAA